MKTNSGSILTILSMGYLPLSAIIGSASAFLYMGLPLDPILLITAWTIVFCIYGLNRFTDTEDMINNPEKRIFFRDNTWLLYFIYVLLALSVFFLVITMKFTVFHILIILTGIIYSVKLIPVIDKTGNVRLTRLKEIPFAKSLSVAAIWGTSFFIIPIALYPEQVVNLNEIILFIISFTLAVFVNTNFMDIVDYRGDKISGIPTIPVRYGIKITLIYTIAVPSVLWTAAIVFMFSRGNIQGLVAAILFVNLVFPLFYICGYFLKFIPGKIIDLAADSCSYVFSAGILLIYIVRNQIL